MNRTMVAVWAALCVIFFSYNLHAQEAPKKPVEAANVDARKSRKDVTKEELVDKITKRLGRTKQIMSFIPGLGSGEDASGNTYYTYAGERIESLDKEKLQKLYSSVQTQATRINTDRLNRQLASMRQAQNAAQASRQIQPPPQPPRVPQPPPQPPDVPQPPREPPRR